MPRLSVRNVIAAGASIALAHVACAQPGLDDAPERSRVSLVCESDALVPGSTTMLAAVIEIDKGWHTYADSVNDSGSQLIASWSLPEGLEIGEPIWTASHRYVQAGGILDHVYENKAVVMFPVNVTSAVPIGDDAVISASFEWLVCDANLCLPQFAEVSIALPVQSRNEFSSHAGVFEEARKQLGKLATGARGDAILIQWQLDTLVISNALGYELEFIPGPGCAKPEGLLESGHSDTGTLELTFDFDAHPRAEVVGWVRLLQPKAKRLPPVESDLYLVRLEQGKGPTRILGGSRTSQ